MRLASRLTTATLILATAGWGSLAVAIDSHCQDGVGSDRPTTPAADFIDLGNGIVQHEVTRLQWSRCAIGQTYRNGSCEGRAIVYYWDEAQDAVDQVNRTGEIAGHNDWRLPTVEELRSIVEECREAPAINTSIFPNTPGSGFWTATLHDDGERRVDDYDVQHVDGNARRGAHRNDNEEDENGLVPVEAWFVGFFKGLEYPYNVESSYRVRPVRSN